MPSKKGGPLPFLSKLTPHAATPNLPAAVLAGLTATGTSFLELRTIIGR
ncbi:hypothetical protein [Streptomyces gardneri]